MEEWKDIPGYEGIYQASTDGRIRTAEGKTTFSKRNGARVWKQRIMKQKCNRNSKGRSDFRIELWKDGSHKTWLVSRLVALTWCGGYKDGMTVNHIDGNYHNNHADNLEWVNLSDNINLGFENGLYKTQKKCVLINEIGERFQFRSQSQASRGIGRSNQYIANKLLRNKPIRSVDGHVYRIEFN